MRILIVNPAADNAFARVGFIVPPLGPAYVAAALRAAGHEVAMHDFAVNADKPDYSLYDMVGISGDTFRHNAALKIAREASAAGALVAIGGPHVTFMDSDAAYEDCIDFVVRGEGEEAMAELADTLESGGPLDGVRGITYREDGTLMRNPDRPPPPEPDRLPLPARDLLDMENYRSLEMAKRKMTSIVSSRGCPSGCKFCSSSRFSGRKWRPRSVDSLMAEIRLVTERYGFGGVAFVDDNFTLDPARVIGLCRAITDAGIDIRWWCFSRMDTVVKNPEMVRFMGKAGCRYVFMGIESASDGTLEAYSKKSSTEYAKQAVTLLKKNGIETLGAYILGAPDETREQIEDTIRLSLKLDTGGVQYTLLTPYPGTALWDEMGDRLLHRKWEKFDCTHAVLRSEHLSPGELEALLYRAYKKFYIRPKRVAISLLSAVRGRGVKISEVKRLIEGMRG